MIQHVQSILIRELDDYLDTVEPAEARPHIVAGNIGFAASMGGAERFMNERLVLSLVNIMEESTLKNRPSTRLSPIGSERVAPPVFLNAYFLFSALFPYDGNDRAQGSLLYARAITRINYIIEFFQGKQVFTIQNSPINNLLHEPHLQDVTIKMEMVSLSFEQINYLWGSLGGRQLPSVLYKAHVIPVSRSVVQERTGIVQQVELDQHPSNL